MKKMLFFVIILTILGKISGEESFRVINGTNATIEDYPFMAKIGSCGASILNEYWVLTAAHCTGDSVYVGTQNYSEEYYDVMLWIRHEDFNSWSLENDIAVVRLVYPIIFNNKTSPVTLPDAMLEIPGSWETEATLTGFAEIEVFSYRIQVGLVQSCSLLQKEKVIEEVEVLVVSNSDCNEIHGNDMITQSMLCAGSIESDVGFCTEDYGGPLTINGTQIGIVSWSMKPCASVPGVYTKVSHYIDWIKEKTGI